jgi:hypothetical protein
MRQGLQIRTNRDDFVNAITNDLVVPIALRYGVVVNNEGMASDVTMEQTV